MVAHPAKYSTEILELLSELLEGQEELYPVLDPMAGVGRLAELEVPLLLGEIEPEWAAACPLPAFVGDAARMPFPDGSIRCICTSPTYGNRMADRYAGDAKRSRRYTYRISLGHRLHPENTGGFQWGAYYQYKHRAILWECFRVLAPGAPLVINISDHIRKGRRMPVTRWFFDECLDLGFEFHRSFRVHTKRMKNGQNAELRADHEYVMVFTKPEEAA